MRVQLIGLNEFNKETQQLILKHQRDKEDIIVGFTQNYAVFVHENLEAKHKKGKTAKYLSKAVEIARPGYYYTLSQAVNYGKSITQGLLLIGLRIQREAQKIVPIDTGALRASAFTAKETEATAKAAMAKATSDTRRKK